MLNPFSFWLLINSRQEIGKSKRKPVESGIQLIDVRLNMRRFKPLLFAMLLIGLASSAYPAVIASRLDPNEALRAL
jgi:ABC-type lipoprotein release transport system permease subunit